MTGGNPEGTVRDRTEFSAYVAGRRPRLLAAARAITGNDHDAEDLLQSVLARVYLAWDRIEDHAAADRYVRRALANQYASWWRQPWRRAEQVSDLVPEPRRSWTGVPVAGPGDPLEDRDLLGDLLGGLPLQQRRAVVLRHLEQLSEAETARALGVSVGTVKSNTSRGLATLRRLHGDHRAPV